MKYRAKFVVEYVLLRAVSGVVNILPYRAALFLAWLLARLGSLILRKRMQCFEQRMRDVLGNDYSDRQIRTIRRRAWRNICFGMIDLLRTPSLKAESVGRMFTGDSVDLLKPLMKEGRGVILGSGHMGSWELSGIAMGLQGQPMFTIAKTQKNPLTNAHLEAMRARAHVDVLSVNAKTFVGAIRRLRKGEILAILTDIRAKQDGVTVGFLGGRATVPKGMALFARAANVPILPITITRTSWTQHHWEAHEPIFPDRSLERDDDVLRMTQYVMNCLERSIRKHPDQYFWFNKRWILGEQGSL